MVFQYFADTDMLYIELVKGVAIESEEVAPGIVLDFDDQHRVIGIEIEDAGRLIDLSQLKLSALPITNLVFNPPEPAAM
jgi:uncharacterized protein YuzE